MATTIHETIYTGKRKTSSARIRLKAGSGKIMVNGKKLEDYFCRVSLVAKALKALKVINKENEFDIIARINGGGLSSQSGALRHAIAKALDKLDGSNRAKLKPLKLLTRDSRKVERKLFGHKKARKSFQFSKR